MAKSKNLLKEAIADARTIKEVAVQNAKNALTESFSPRIMSMLSTKLNEMEDNELDENQEQVVTEDDDANRDAANATGETEFNSESKLTENETDEVTDVSNMDENLTETEIDEILSELNGNSLDEEMEDEVSMNNDFKGDGVGASNKLGEKKEGGEIPKGFGKPKADGGKPKPAGDSKPKAPAGPDMGAEAGPEEQKVGALTGGQLVDMIKAAVAQIVGGGDLAAGDEELGGEDPILDDPSLEQDEALSMEEDNIDLDELVNGALAEAGEDESMYEGAEEELEEGKDSLTAPLGQTSGTSAPQIAHGKAPGTPLKSRVFKYPKGDPLANATGTSGKTSGKGAPEVAHGKAPGSTVSYSKKLKDNILEKKVVRTLAKQLNEAKGAINELKQSLSDINLLNAKLLYVNKIFRAQSLNEGQKVKVINAFDRARSVTEVKNTFVNLKEALGSVKKSMIKENLGFASKPTGNAPDQGKQIISDKGVIRMQELAGIRKLEY